MKVEDLRVESVLRVCLGLKDLKRQISKIPLNIGTRPVILINLQY